MGEKKGIYNAEFPETSRVRIANAEKLEDFQRRWKYHHPLQSDQIPYADRTAIVTNVMFYHGGDELYELADVPGIWHEECLTAQDSL